MWYIGDDERRRIHLATPMRPKGSGRRGPAAALLLLDDERASSAEQRLASDSMTPRTQPRVLLEETPSPREWRRRSVLQYVRTPPRPRTPLTGLFQHPAKSLAGSAPDRIALDVDSIGKAQRGSTTLSITRDRCT